MKSSLFILTTASLLAGSSAMGAEPDYPLPKKLPAGLEASIFAASPLVNYPTFVAAAPNGDLFVSVDKNGSLDKKPGRGFIYKLVDKDGDGKADTKTVFADNVVSARGLVVMGDSVICLHPPELELFRDKDGDGIAEERKVLVKGIGFDLSKRPPDHTSNGATLGIDGWLYLAIGDFGFMEAEGSDGRKQGFRYGGVLRVRPDGTGMEVFSRGTRNIYGVAVDPWLNAFARDNTNDGGGWDTRVEFYLNGADLGYPRLFKNFTDESFPVLGIFGGGSGVSGVYVQEKGFGWPDGYDDVLYTCDWGRSVVYRHKMKDDRASFKNEQDEFCQVERVTDMQMDCLGRAYIASWRGGMFSYKDENVGYIIQVRPTKPTGVKVDTNFKAKSADALVSDLTNPDSHNRRLAAQGEILRRNEASMPAKLEIAAKNASLTVPARIAALFTLKQIKKAEANVFITNLLADSALREFALRALGDRPEEGANVKTDAILPHLKDANDHVRAQAVITLGRLGRSDAAAGILEIAAENPEAGPQKETKPAFQSPTLRKAKPSADVVVNIGGAKTVYLVATEAGDGMGMDHVAWLEPKFTGAKGEKLLVDLPWTLKTAGFGKTGKNKNCQGNPIKFGGKEWANSIGSHALSVVGVPVPADAEFAEFRATAVLEDVGTNQGDAGSVVFEVYLDELPPSLMGGAPANAETIYTDNRRALPHIASQSLIQLKAWDTCFAALDKDPSKIAAALRVLRNLHSPEVVKGLTTRLAAASSPELQEGILTALVRLYNNEAEWDGSSWGTRPDTSGPYYKRTAWSETPAIEKTLIDFSTKATEPLQKHIKAQLARHQVKIKQLESDLQGGDPQWKQDQNDLLAAMSKLANMKEGDIGLLEPHVAAERTLEILNAKKADAKRGQKLFKTQGCIACHAVGKEDAPKGPNLYDIASRYSPQEIITSIVNPSATVSQGFPTHHITLKNGDAFSGFALKESGDEIVIRNMAAATQAIPLDQIKEHIKDDKVSAMTPGLVNNLPPLGLADLLEYFKSLQKK
jgi:putative heme-binding domain-containing protein